MNEDEFSEWLKTRLTLLKTDESIFGPYILSILQGDEDDPDERIEALDGILVELGNHIDVVCLRNEIMSKWNACGQALTLTNNETTNTDHKPVENGIADQFEKILRLTTHTTESVAVKKTDGTDAKLRAAILSAAENESTGYEDGQLPSCSSDNAGGGKKKSGGVYDADAALSVEFGRNDNAEKVLHEQKEVKERAKAESAKKRERDKEDRAKQKVAAQERKDKAKKKATKVERKR